MRIINHDQNNIRIEFRPDCQEVMAAILGRDDKKIELEKKSKFRIDLRGANLHQLRWDDFDKVNLYGADLSHSNLTHVDFALYWFLHEVRIDLTDVSLINTNLSGADLRFTKGLTQIQLDSACAYPDSPPNLSDLVDAKSGKTLEWRGQPPEDLA